MEGSAGYVKTLLKGITLGFIFLEITDLCRQWGNI